MRRIIGFICGIITMVSIFALIGIAGAIDCNPLALAEAAPKVVVWLVVMIVGGIGVKTSGIDEVEDSVID